jgi:hypothetical protein
MAKPKYPHKCDSCIYLGRRRGLDLYACPAEWRDWHGGRRVTLLGRFGRKGYQYYSTFTDHAQHAGWSREALKRAIKKGIA